MKRFVKKCCYSAMNSCFYGISITLIVYVVIMSCNGGALPMIPEYVEKFSSPVFAILVQLILIGVMSASFGGGSFIMELERVSLLLQSVLYFAITTAIWFPIANFCWNFTKYPTALIGIGISYVVSYAISWIVQYRICKKNIEEINRKLERMRNEETIN